VIVPSAAGGAQDTVNRVLAERLQASLKQPVILDFRPGAGGVLGLDALSRAKSDGYTFGIIASSAATTRAVYPNLGVDVRSGLSHLGMYFQCPMVLVVNPDIPANSVPEFLELAKKSPGKLNYSSAGVGNLSHLMAEQFKAATGADIVHVPYKSSAQYVTDLIGGQVEMCFALTTSVLQFIASKQVKALAITSEVRSRALPDLPTMRELGYPQVEYAPWSGLGAPAGISGDIIAQVNGVLAEMVKVSSVIERYRAIGGDTSYSTPQEMTDHLKDDVAFFEKIARARNITATP
jgi:tripartite-type tricarboxylate transporter receptor subunit TctC